MKKKIIIVGGTGFLGFHLAKLCLKKKFVPYDSIVIKNSPFSPNMPKLLLLKSIIFP